MVRRHERKGNELIDGMERFAFCERAKKAYAILATEKKIYGCMIIKKGVIR